MKHLTAFFFSFLFVFSGLSQELAQYKDIINLLDDDYQTIEANLAELKTTDLSHLWLNENSRRPLGFIGTNYLRLHIKFLSVAKNPDDSLEYLVEGKSMVGDNICAFQGTLKIKASSFIKSLESPEGNEGILAGEYTFSEDPQSKNAGIFTGRFATYWFQDVNSNIQYNDLWSGAASYNNNQFAETWREYGKERHLKARWGDGRIPLSGDLDVGTSEFGPAEKYASNGWISFVTTRGASPERMKIDAARKAENREWWKQD